MRIAQIRESIARWGIGRLGFVWLYRALLRPVGVRIFVVSIREIVPRTSRKPHAPDLTFKPLAPSLLHDLAKDPSLYLHSEFLGRALAQGDFCIGAFRDNELIAYAWRSFAQAPAMPDMPGVAVRVAPPYCYTYKVFTRREYRGQGVWPALSLSGIADDASLAAGCNRLIGYVELDNLSSLGANERIGAVRLGLAGYFALFSFRWVFHGAHVRATTFRFVSIK